MSVYAKGEEKEKLLVRLINQFSKKFRAERLETEEEQKKYGDIKVTNLETNEVFYIEVKSHSSLNCEECKPIAPELMFPDAADIFIELYVSSINKETGEEEMKNSWFPSSKCNYVAFTDLNENHPEKESNAFFFIKYSPAIAKGISRYISKSGINLTETKKDPAYTAFGYWVNFNELLKSYGAFAITEEGVFQGSGYELALKFNTYYEREVNKLWK